jgi:hypothetical protein
MRVISRKTPAPRLLSTVVPELRAGPPERMRMKSRLKGASIFSGNGRAIFLGMIVGAVLISTISALYVRRLAGLRRAEEARKVLAVSTHRISPAEPITVKISADLIHVSAISLGQRRLAIINGRLVTEGEQIVVRPPSSSIAVTLRVVKISDGSIQLSDGTQVITARLEVSPASKPKP